MSEYQTFAVIDPNGDLVGSVFNETIKEAWNEVENWAWRDAKWQQLEEEGYKLIKIDFKIVQEVKVKTKDYL